MHQNLLLVDLLVKNSSKYPTNIAVIDALNNSISYEQLNIVSDQIASILKEYGIKTNTRVGLWMAKSIATVSAIFGILKCAAAYVPTDPMGPPERNSFIFKDCSVKAVLVERSLLPRLEQGMDFTGYEIHHSLAPLCIFDTDIVLVTFSGEPFQSAQPDLEHDGENLAYILYTSGSTGKPKGVPHTHHSAMSFINWCSTEFLPTCTDRFSSHAPFHFDLSILDIYVPIKHGARICVIDENLGKQPLELAKFIAAQKLTFWYSTPSILRMLFEFGKLDTHDFSALKKVFFAGEVFPIKQLQELGKYWQTPVYYNLYGPTETNVCTYYKVTSEDLFNAKQPVPIGMVCSGDSALIMDVNGNQVYGTNLGELYISGGSVMKGYWNAPEKTQEAFYLGADGERWYKTGDIVSRNLHGDIVYQGRSDRMVKKRGFRVELGEIESVLYLNEDISEVAVIALNDGNDELLIYALACPKNVAVNLSMIKLKQFCSQNLPYYMVPDRFKFLPSLPKTSTDKIDYQSLREYL